MVNVKASYVEIVYRRHSGEPFSSALLLFGPIRRPLGTRRFPIGLAKLIGDTEYSGNIFRKWITEVICRKNSNRSKQQWFTEYSISIFNTTHNKSCATVPLITPGNRETPAGIKLKANQSTYLLRKCPTSWPWRSVCRRREPGTRPATPPDATVSGARCSLVRMGALWLGGWRVVA